MANGDAKKVMYSNFQIKKNKYNFSHESIYSKSTIHEFHCNSTCDTTISKLPFTLKEFTLGYMYAHFTYLK